MCVHMYVYSSKCRSAEAANASRDCGVTHTHAYTHTPRYTFTYYIIKRCQASASVRPQKAHPGGRAAAAAEQRANCGSVSESARHAVVLPLAALHFRQWATPKHVGENLFVRSHLFRHSAAAVQVGVDVNVAVDGAVDYFILKAKVINVERASKLASVLAVSPNACACVCVCVLVYGVATACIRCRCSSVASVYTSNVPRFVANQRV